MYNFSLQNSLLHSSTSSSDNSSICVICSILKFSKQEPKPYFPTLEPNLPSIVQHPFRCPNLDDFCVWSSALLQFAEACVRKCSEGTFPEILPSEFCAQPSDPSYLLENQESWSTIDGERNPGNYETYCYIKILPLFYFLLLRKNNLKEIRGSEN